MNVKLKRYRVRYDRFFLPNCHIDIDAYDKPEAIQRAAAVAQQDPNYGGGIVQDSFVVVQQLKSPTSKE